MVMTDPWSRYGRSLAQAMAEVLEEIPEDLRAHVLETADYWLSVGIQLGLERPHQARELLAIVETDELERAALAEDAASFIAEALA
jgi:hypothetical protein